MYLKLWIPLIKTREQCLNNMQNKAKILFIISLFVLLATPLYCEVVDKIAIVVNNEIITQGEVDRIMAPLYEQLKNAYKGEELMKKLEEARQHVVQQLIEDKLVLSEAKKVGVEVDEKEVDQKLEEAEKRFGGKANFEKVLMEQRMSLKELRMRYKEQSMSKKMIDQKIGSRVVVSPVEVNEYYNQHLNEFVRPAEVKLRNILIKPMEGMDAKRALALAKEISDRLKKGEDFGELAKTYSHGPNASEGGIMGYVKKGDLLPEIENAIMALKEGETSDIIQTAVGYHIFKVEEKREERTLPLSEIRHEVEEAIFRVKTREKIKGWIEGLKKNAYIAFK